jgi:hypothetical protein
MAVNALVAAIVIFDYAAGTFLVWRAFEAYPDHSGLAVFRWCAIYVMAVIQPIAWAIYHLRVLRSRGFVIDGQLRAIAVAPMIAGGITLLIAVNLITGG